MILTKEFRVEKADTYPDIARSSEWKAVQLLVRGRGNRHLSSE